MYSEYIRLYSDYSVYYTLHVWIGCTGMRQDQISSGQPNRRVGLKSRDQLNRDDQVSRDCIARLGGVLRVSAGLVLPVVLCQFVERAVERAAQVPATKLLTTRA